MVFVFYISKIFQNYPHKKGPERKSGPHERIYKVKLKIVSNAQLSLEP